MTSLIQELPGIWKKKGNDHHIEFVYEPKDGTLWLSETNGSKSIVQIQSNECFPNKLVFKSKWLEWGEAKCEISQKTLSDYSNSHFFLK